MSGRALRISAKDSMEVCKALRGMALPRATGFLEQVIAGKQSIRGKYHTSTAKEFLSLLKSAEANADFRGLDAERLFLQASAHKGYSYHTSRRIKSRGQKRGVTHIDLVLTQR